MMWSLIVVACVATPDGVACHEAKWHLIESHAECLRMRNRERRAVEEAEPLRVVARCEAGFFS